MRGAGTIAEFDAASVDAALAVVRAAERERLALYRPYPRQIVFHAGGAAQRERLFIAGNQLGKTLAGAAEMAIHLTGRYPDWWPGRRFARAVVAWAAGITAESTRDNPQRLLLGRPGAWGEGMIPAAALGTPSLARGVADLVDTVRVAHAGGGFSTLAFRSYEKGRAKWQGETLDLVWFDEEPPEDVYAEGLTRTNATGGMVYVTATPLLGMTALMRRFLEERSEDRGHVQMTIDDVAHYGAADRARIVAAYAPHERDARTRGVPMLGSGLVFAGVNEDELRVPPFAVPPHWPQIAGIDFGWDHPTAAIRLAWDREADRIYLIDAYRRREAVPALHAAALIHWGRWLPWAWPQDGLQHSKDTGEPLAAQYRILGLAMLGEHAAAPVGGVSLEASLLDLHGRMTSDRFKVFANLADWFGEFRLYHRRDGRIVAENDDLLSATRYALMMLRHARVKPTPAAPPPRESYHPFAW